MEKDKTVEKIAKIIAEQRAKENYELAEKIYNLIVSNDIDKETNKSKFRPYLMYGDEFMGYIGEPTKLVDSDGKPLCLGDIVELIVEPVGDLFIDLIAYTLVHDKNRLVVVKDDETEFIMGLKEISNRLGDFNFVSIKKVEQQIKHNDEVFRVRFVLEEEKK